MYFADFACTSAIGISAAMTMAALDAEVCGYKDSDFICYNNQPATMALLDDGLFTALQITSDYDGAISEQMIREGKLLFFALDDLQHRFPASENYPLLWLGNEPEGAENIPTEFICDLFNKYSAPINLSQVITINLGRASAIAALQKAHQLLHQYGHNYVLIGGSHSPSDNQWLKSLDQQQRLKNQDAKDAFVPGEASAFLLLAKTPELAQAYSYIGADNNPTVHIHVPGMAKSESHWYNRQAHKGEALHQAMAAAIQHNPSASIDAISSSLNGELFWIKEHRVALARLAPQLKDAKLYHNAEYLGDVGPLSGLLQLGQSAHYLKTQQHTNVLAYASSDGPWRSASLLTTKPTSF